LNYEQFIRSVLLAQGDFTAFLKADKDQKASLLEKLTGTHIYSELSKRVFERCREEDQQLRLLQRSQEGIVILTAEELADLREREIALANTLEQLEARINATLTELKWHEDRDNYEAQVREAERVFQACFAEKEQAADRGTYLKQVEQVQPTRTWIDALQEATGLLIQKKDALEDARVHQQLLARQTADIEIVVAETAGQLQAQVIALEEANPVLN